MSPLDPATVVARGGAIDADPYGATSPPLYQTATFGQRTATGFDEFDYTRTDNPTRRAVEDLLAELEGARTALTFSSGMAAIAAVLRIARPGERVLCGRDLYGGTQRFLHEHLSGVVADHVDLTIGEDGRPRALERALATRGARILFVETPSNPRLEVVDLRSVARAAHAVGTLVVVDGTAMTPWLQRPLELGADVVVHSATKGLAGHGDVTAGVVATRDEALARELAARRNAEGTALAPFESWLLRRGVETLGVRLERAQSTALRLAKWLSERPEVERVSYPGLASHPGALVHAAQTVRDDAGGVLVTVECSNDDTARRLVESTELFSTSVSFGGVASSISLPHYMSHASTPEGAAPRPSPRLVRISVGLEAFDDLTRDLDSAFAAAPKPRREPSPILS